MLELISRTFEGKSIKSEKVFDTLTRKYTKVRSVLADIKDLPKERSAFGLENIIYKVDSRTKIIEGIYEMDYGNSKTPIHSTIIEVRRELLRIGFLGMKTIPGQIVYHIIGENTYLPGDAGWQEKYKFINLDKAA